VLRQLPVVRHPDLLVGTETGDDAAVYRLGEDCALIFTTDYFPPIVDDPYDYGQIAVANALSDVYAKGGRPLMALNLVNFPDDLSKDILVTILKGAYAKADEAGLLIVGGQTITDKEPKYGLAVVGLVKPGEQVINASAKPGDRLVLTKPIGTGIITTAHKRNAIPPAVLSEAVRQMATLNRGAAEAMQRIKVSACTDITGFGLLGHLRGMVEGSKVKATIHLSRVPLLSGVRELAAQGIAPGGSHRNLESVMDMVEWDAGISAVDRLLLADAQTSGGLLISVPASRLDKLVRELEKERVETIAVIGEIEAAPPGRIKVTP
jgi:selenide,water dikinase